MSARNLLPVAAELAEPVAAAVPPTTPTGLLTRLAMVYGRLRKRLHAGSGGSED